MRRIATDILTRASSQVQPEGEEPDGAAKDDPPAREEHTIGEAGDELRALEARAKQLLQLSEHALARSLLANPADPVQSPQRYVYARDRDGRLVSPREAPTYKEPRGAPMDLWSHTYSRSHKLHDAPLKIHLSKIQILIQKKS